MGHEGPIALWARSSESLLSEPPRQLSVRVFLCYPLNLLTVRLPCELRVFINGPLFLIFSSFSSFSFSSFSFSFSFSFSLSIYLVSQRAGEALPRSKVESGFVHVGLEVDAVQAEVDPVGAVYALRLRSGCSYVGVSIASVYR